MTTFYLTPSNHTKPSWGLAIIYYHVYILNQNGCSAYLVKEKTTDRARWLEIDIPIIDVEKFHKTYKDSDILVVPEVLTNFKNLSKINCRKILFAQASAYLFESMPVNSSHLSLGINEAFVIMPHLDKIVKKHLGLTTYLIPPFIDEYCFNKKINLKSKKRRILMYPKDHIIDYSVIKYLIKQSLSQLNPKGLKKYFQCDNWEIVELKDLSHHDAIDLIASSEIFISLNLFEALNTSIVEAMALKTIVFCYEGYGPRDFLKNNVNAFVFQNNEAYELASKVIETIINFDSSAEILSHMKENAFLTAKDYNIHNTEKALLSFYRNQKLLG